MIETITPIISIIIITIVILGVFLFFLLRIIHNKLNKISIKLTNLNRKIQDIKNEFKDFKVIEKDRIKLVREGIFDIKKFIFRWERIFSFIGKFTQRFFKRIKYQMISECSRKVNKTFNNKFLVRWWSKILLINLWNKIFKDTI